MRGALAVAIVLTLASSAHATDKAKAREAYHRASQHYDLGEYKEALEDFKDAYRNFEDPAFLFNIAQCHRLLGDSRLAVREYRTYLMKLPSAPNSAEVREVIDKLEKQLAEEQAIKTAPPQGMTPPTGEKPPETVQPVPPQKPTEPAPAPVATPMPTPPEPAPAPVATPPPSEPAPASVSANESVTATPSETPRTPVYKKWWLWTTIAAVVVVGVGVGLGVGLSQSASTPSANTALGTFKF